jgi:hypothetical protein
MKTIVNSAESILAKMKGQSVTSKWDAIIFYNRSMSNHVLEQEYIKFFTEGKWYNPMTQTLQAQGQTEKVYLSEVVFSQPMVSFVSRHDGQDPVLQLTWFIKSGEYILYDGTDIRSEGDFNPVTGPTLTCQLGVSEGGVKDGKVVLNLETSYAWRFNFTHNADFDNQYGYLVMGTLLNLLYPEQKEIVLSQIISTGGVDWNPTSFRVEVKMPETARLLDGYSYDDGAIKVYVGLDGNTEGGIPTPDSDIYMIPDDGDYTAAIVISNKAIMEKVLSKGFVTMGDAGTGSATAIEIKENTDLYKLEAVQGSLNIQGHWFNDIPGLTAVQIAMLIGKVPVSDIQKAEFSIAMADDQVSAEWKGYQPLTFDYNNSQYIGELNWQKNISGEFLTLSDTEVGLKLKDNSAVDSLLIPGPGMPDEIVEKWLYVSNVYNDNVVKPSVERGLERLISRVPSFNTFALQSVLFKNGNVIALEKAHTPGDMVVFGKFRPGLTSIEMVNAMPHLVVGEVYKFDVNESARGMTLIWSVAPLNTGKEYYEGDIGTINRLTGEYTAPLTITGDYIQVKVTVADEHSDTTSVALVSISKDSIQIVPRKFKVDQDGGELRFKALSHNKTEVTRTMPANSVSSCERDPGIIDQWIFKAGKLPFVDPEYPEYGTVAFHLEEVTFSTALATKTAVALVVSKTQSFELSYTLSDDKKTALFIAKLRGVSKECEWVKLIGPGSMSKEGVYTFDPESDDDQSIIVNASLIADPSFSTADFFSFTNLELLTQQIRSGNAPACVPCDIAAMERHNRINRNLYIK